MSVDPPALFLVRSLPPLCVLLPFFCHTTGAWVGDGDAAERVDGNVDGMVVEVGVERLCGGCIGHGALELGVEVAEQGGVGAEVVHIIAEVEEQGCGESVEYLQRVDHCLWQGITAVDVSHNGSQGVHLSAVDGRQGTTGCGVRLIERVEGAHHVAIGRCGRSEVSPHGGVGHAHGHDLGGGGHEPVVAWRRA